MKDLVMLGHLKNPNDNNLWDTKMIKDGEKAYTINNIRVGAHLTYTKTFTETENGNHIVYLGIVCLDDYHSNNKAYEERLDTKTTWKFVGGINVDILWSSEWEENGCSLKYRVIQKGEISEEYCDVFEQSITSVALYGDYYLLFIHRSKLHCVDIRTKEQSILKSRLPTDSTFVISSDLLMIWSSDSRKKIIFNLSVLLYDEDQNQEENNENNVEKTYHVPTVDTTLNIAMDEEIIQVTPDMILTRSTKTSKTGNSVLKIYNSTGSIIWSKEVSTDKAIPCPLQTSGLCENLAFTIENSIEFGNYVVAMIDNQIKEIFVGNRTCSNLFSMSDEVYGFLGNLDDQIINIKMLLQGKKDGTDIKLKDILHCRDKFTTSIYPSLYHPWVTTIKNGIISIKNTSNVLQTPFLSTKLKVSYDRNLNIKKVIIPPLLYKHKNLIFFWIQTNPRTVSLYSYTDGIRPQIEKLSDVYLDDLLENQYTQIARWKVTNGYNVLYTSKAAILFNKSDYLYNKSISGDDVFATLAGDVIEDVACANDTVWFIVTKDDVSDTLRNISFVAVWHGGKITTKTVSKPNNPAIRYISCVALEDLDKSTRTTGMWDSCLVIKTTRDWKLVSFNRINEKIILEDNYMSDDDFVDKELLCSTGNVVGQILFSTNHSILSTKKSGVYLYDVWKNKITEFPNVIIPTPATIDDSGINYICMNSMYIWVVCTTSVTRIRIADQSTTMYDLPTCELQDNEGKSHDYEQIPTHHVMLDSEYCPMENDIIFFNSFIFWLCSRPQYPVKMPFKPQSSLSYVSSGYNSVLISENTIHSDSDVDSIRSIDTHNLLPTKVTSDFYEMII